MPAFTAVHYQEDASPQALAGMTRACIDGGARGLLIFAATGDEWLPETVDPLLRGLPVPVLGGVFPGLVHQGQQHQHGLLVAGLSFVPELSIIRHLSSQPEAVRLQVEASGEALQRGKGHIVLVDGLAANLERLTEALYREVGTGKGIAGGGAGALDFIQRPCLFSNEGLLMDAALIASLPRDLYNGIRHGWDILAGPHLVTASDALVLQQLNYEPAYDVYRREVEAASGCSFDGQPFFDLAKRFPLGIERLDSEILVRDPLTTDNGELTCVGEVPEHAMVYLLRGQAASLSRAAGDAARAARREFDQAGGDTRPPSALFFDCISRVLYLEEHFSEELAAIGQGLGDRIQAPGVLSLGEIGNAAKGTIDLLNKSTVVAVL